MSKREITPEEEAAIEAVLVAFRDLVPTTIASVGVGANLINAIDALRESRKRWRVVGAELANPGFISGPGGFALHTQQLGCHALLDHIVKALNEAGV